MGLLGYGMVLHLSQKYSYPHGQSKGKLPFERASFFNPKLRICAGIVAFWEKGLKTRVQSTIFIKPFLLENMSDEKALQR